MLKLFSGNGYSCFLTGELPCPEKYIVSKGGEVVENPLYSQWVLTDQNLASTIYAIIFPSLISYVLNLNTCVNILVDVEKRLQLTNCVSMIFTISPWEHSQ